MESRRNMVERTTKLILTNQIKLNIRALENLQINYNGFTAQNQKNSNLHETFWEVCNSTDFCRTINLAIQPSDIVYGLLIKVAFAT